MNSDATKALSTGRLVLEPLQVEHADEMCPVLADLELCEFTEPPTGDVLAAR